MVQLQIIYRMILIMSVRCIGTQHAIVYYHFVFLLLRVQEKLHLLIQQLSSALPKEIKFVIKEHKFKDAVKRYLSDRMQQ